MALFMVKTWMGNKATPIYGVEWAGTSDPSWTRTDDAVGFSDPNPYYAGMSTTPSSPFDNIMPWAGMRRVTDANAGELVEIPKFYYKWTRDGIKMKLQISMSQFDGSHVSPAHMDRGDGVGERDYVYIGRYHCASDFKSKSGYAPLSYTSRSQFRTGIHNLGSSIWQQDFALYWTIRMLYLVEFANWDSQSAIGNGGGNNSSTEASGASDNMPYHTGTIKSSRSNFGVGVQYRYIEDLWGNLMEFVDGIYFSTWNIYCIKNPSQFSDTSNGTLVGTKATSDGWITAFTNPTVTGFEYALYPNATNDSLNDSVYTCDYCNVGTGNGRVLLVGGFYGQNQSTKYHGFFYNTSGWADNDTPYISGGRLMVLPPSRLSA